MATKPINNDEKILKAIQLLYTDVYKTLDKQLEIEKELHEIKLHLISILKRFQALDEFEKKLFVDNLKKN